MQEDTEIVSMMEMSGLACVKYNRMWNAAQARLIPHKKIAGKIFFYKSDLETIKSYFKNLDEERKSKSSKQEEKFSEKLENLLRKFKKSVL